MPCGARTTAEPSKIHVADVKDAFDKLVPVLAIHVTKRRAFRNIPIPTKLYETDQQRKIIPTSTKGSVPSTFR